MSLGENDGDVMADQLATEYLTQEITKQVVATLAAAGMVNMPRQKKKRVFWERKLAMEYVAHFYPDQPRWFRVEVGPIPHGDETMLYARTRRWADAIVRAPDGMIIIETKMKAVPAAVSQLELYAQLFPETPMFKRYKGEPIEKKLVCALGDDNTKDLCKAHGISYEVFRPSNYEEWFKVIIQGETTGEE